MNSSNSLISYLFLVTLILSTIIGNTQSATCPPTCSVFNKVNVVVQYSPAGTGADTFSGFKVGIDEYALLKVSGASLSVEPQSSVTIHIGDKKSQPISVTDGSKFVSFYYAVVTLDAGKIKKIEWINSCKDNKCLLGGNNCVVSQCAEVVSTNGIRIYLGWQGQDAALNALKSATNILTRYRSYTIENAFEKARKL